jgi:hypothetical protein
VIFWRTHFAWSVEWEEWGNPGYGEDRWQGKFMHHSDYDTAMNKWDEVKGWPPGKARNIRLNRRPVGAPMNWLKSS